MSREVIVFLGRQGSGKNYQSDKFIKRGYKKLSFADPLRRMACHVLGMDFEEAMKEYDKLKVTPLYKNLTFRNILENLGSGVREVDKDFWVKAVIEQIRTTEKNIVIDDMRYPNEYLLVADFCREHNITFRAYLCDYHSDRYNANNKHESAALANYLVDTVHLKDLQEVPRSTIEIYASKDKTDKLSEDLKEQVEKLRKFYK